MRRAAGCEQRHRRFAGFFETLAKAVRGVDGDTLRLPSVYARRQKKKPRAGDRTDIEGSIKAHLGWLRRRGVVPQAMRVSDALCIADGLRSVDRDERKKGVEPSDVVVICRSLHELVLARDTDLLRAIRALAQVLADVAETLEAIVIRVEKDNPTVRSVCPLHPKRVQTALTFSEAAATRLPATAALNLALNHLGRVAGGLRTLDTAVREKCLTAPYDHAPRGTRPEQITYLAAVKTLDGGGFDEAAIADLVLVRPIENGRRETAAARVRRVRDSLDRHKDRDRRTRYV